MNSPGAYFWDPRAGEYRTDDFPRSDVGLHGAEWSPIASDATSDKPLVFSGGQWEHERAEAERRKEDDKWRAWENVWGR